MGASGVLSGSSFRRGKFNKTVKSSENPDNNTNPDKFSMRLIVCEDNEAVIKIVQKQRSMAMRHVSRTHRICLDWTFEVMQNPSVSLCYVNTMYQIADMMTKAITRKDVWIVLLSLIAIEAENGGPA